MTAMTDMDYVEFYAKRLRDDGSLFEQHKRSIESQMLSSSSLFRNHFGTGEEFKANARKYLRDVGLIKDLER